LVEVNEEIVCKWLEEVKGFFVVSDVKYRVPRGWSDIDIIAHNPKTRESWVVEVKGWHTEYVPPSYVKYIKSQLNPEARVEIRKKLGNERYKRILVVPRLSKRANTRQKTISSFNRKGIHSVYEFVVILQELIATINEHKSYDSEVLQTLRLLRVYKPRIP